MTGRRVLLPPLVVAASLGKNASVDLSSNIRLIARSSTKDSGGGAPRAPVANRTDERNRTIAPFASFSVRLVWSRPMTASPWKDTLFGGDDIGGVFGSIMAMVPDGQSFVSVRAALCPALPLPTTTKSKVSTLLEACSLRTSREEGRDLLVDEEGEVANTKGPPDGVSKLSGG